MRKQLPANLQSLRLDAPSAECFGLSVRQWEVLELLAEGLRRKEIAARLGVAEYTVTEHLKAIYRKLEVNSRTLAVIKVFGRNRPVVFLRGQDSCCPHCGCQIPSKYRHAETALIAV